LINPAVLSPAVLDSAALVVRAEPGWLWTLEGTVAVIIAVLLIGLLGAIALLIWRLSKAFERIVDAVEKFRTDIMPVTEKAASIAEHLEEAALSVKDSVEGVTDTINTANEALRDAVATADARFREFDAIVRVARDEAEDAVVGAASVIRGVRSGASAFRHRRAAQRDDDDEGERDVPAPRRRGGPRTRHQRSEDAE
jgi:hypothetical protein